MIFLFFKGKQRKEAGLNKEEVSQPVFYGVTSYVAESLEHYISIAGEPVVFTGSDEEVQKYKNTLFFY